ncbi:MAG: hypothetical protein NPIRA03_27860 [Nitrospirales bacterium]|nr:MAG: hypothetical protein NPIRA03_27860 [Nitrospirales bacterium]
MAIAREAVRTHSPRDGISSYWHTASPKLETPEYQKSDKSKKVSERPLVRDPDMDSKTPPHTATTLIFKKAISYEPAVYQPFQVNNCSRHFIAWA